MIVIEPSYEIQDELDRSSLVIRLEACGRICYKSEEKISAGSALPFVTRIAEHGHNSVMEMAVLTLQLSCSSLFVTDFLACQPRYFIVDPVPDGVLITGSIRAFREIYTAFPENAIVQAMLDFLGDSHPYLLQGVWKPMAREKKEAIAVAKLPLAQVEALPSELLSRHRFVGVKFITNRAVTHEIVRHRPCSFLQESQRYCRYSQDKFGNQVSFIKPLFFAPESAEYRVWLQAMEQSEALYLKLLENSTPQAARTVLPNSCKTEIIVYCNLAEWQHIFRLRTSPAAEPSMRELMIPLETEMKKRYPQLFS